MANPLHLITRSFDIRKDEYRKLFLSFSGAFLIIAFMIFARSLREGFYLSQFDAKTLPYIIASTAFLGFPTVSMFVKMLSRYSAAYVLKMLMILLAAGILILFPFIETSIGIVIFYMFTAMGAMVLASGFWVFTSERYPLRRAKKLFGLVSAGGTLGAMVAGISIGWLNRYFETSHLIFFLVGLLVLFFTVQLFMPKPLEQTTEEDSKSEKTTTREAFGRAWKNKHLRIIALIVMTATLASTLIDYQFKEIVKETLTTKQQLTSFFGSFYGWTGGIALLFQLIIVSRLMSFLGISKSLAFLPILLLIGSIGILIFPILAMVTVVRGADNSTRKSFYRSIIEVLYVPVSDVDRKKTKSFIDVVLDSVAEGIGAGIIFLWVTWANFPSKFLSCFVIGLTGCFFVWSRLMGLEYFQTLIQRMKEGQQPQDLIEATPLDGRRLLTVNMTRTDLRDELRKRGITFEDNQKENRDLMRKEHAKEDLHFLLSSGVDEKIARAFQQHQEWRVQHVPDLIKLLARDDYLENIVSVIEEIGQPAADSLIKSLKDENEDFVIRRRIPRLLARIGGSQADQSLVAALMANRFEIRYRAAVALMRRCKNELPHSNANWKDSLWQAIRHEIQHEKPVWELNRLLDKSDDITDEIVSQKVGFRGALSMEHTFRMLSLVLDEEPVKMAYRGIMEDNARLKSIALEYLEYVLPDDIKEKLWVFIGDISDYQKLKAKRPVEQVVSDLIKTGATLFASDKDKATLKKALSQTKKNDK